MPYESKILESLGLDFCMLKGCKSLVADLVFCTVQYDRVVAVKADCTNSPNSVVDKSNKNGDTIDSRKTAYIN